MLLFCWIGNMSPLLSRCRTIASRLLIFLWLSATISDYHFSKMASTWRLKSDFVFGQLGLWRFERPTMLQAPTYAKQQDSRHDVDIPLQDSGALLLWASDYVIPQVSRMMQFRNRLMFWSRSILLRFQTCPGPHFLMALNCSASPKHSCGWHINS
jgi:hypothetical protein